MFYRFSFLSLFVLCSAVAFLISCEEPARVFIEPDCPEVEPEIVEVPVLMEPEEPEGFRPDFTVITMYDQVQDLFRGLRQHNIVISEWTHAAMSNPLFVLSGERKTYHIVVISMSEMGFTAPATYDAILERAGEIGLMPMSFEIALMLREQFLAQPDRLTGHRLGAFFAAIDPPIAFPGVRDGIPKIPSIERDDKRLQPEINIGLWVLLNELEFVGGNVRVFDPLNDPDGVDLGGRFVLPTVF